MFVHVVAVTIFLASVPATIIRAIAPGVFALTMAQTLSEHTFIQRAGWILLATITMLFVIEPRPIIAICVDVYVFLRDLHCRCRLGIKPALFIRPSSDFDRGSLLGLHRSLRLGSRTLCQKVVE